MTLRASSKPEPITQPPSEPEPIVVRMPLDVRSAALTVIAVLAGILVLRMAQAVFVPIVLGVLISHALEPVVGRLSSWRIPRPLGAAFVVLLVVGAGAFLVQELRVEAVEIANQLPSAARRFRQSLGRNPAGGTAIEQVQKAADELEKAADAATPQSTPDGVLRVQVDQPAIPLNQYLMGGTLGLLAAAGQLVVLLFLVYFLLVSGDLYRRKLVKIVGPSLTKKKITVQILQEIDRQIETFLLIQVFTSALVALATWLAFKSLGLEQAGVWALLAGIFNSVPYLGPVVVTMATGVGGYLQFGTIEKALLFAGVALLITTLEGFLLTPWLTSRAARMNAVAIFVGLLFWGWVWNVWGLLLAVPMLVVVKAVCDHVEDFKAIGELLGD